MYYREWLLLLIALGSKEPRLLLFAQLELQKVISWNICPYSNRDGGGPGIWADVTNWS